MTHFGLLGNDKGATTDFLKMLSIIQLLLALAFACAAMPWNRTLLVDTRIGTGGGGWGIAQLNPGPQVPFGAMRLGPDTSLGLEPIRLTFDDFAGYYYFNNHIECFSHTHVVGAGEGDFQNFGVIVTRGLADDTIKNCNYRSLFSHDQEVSKVGYYAVNLLTPNVYAEVAVSGTHSGIHRYTARNTAPQPADPPSLLIDICHGVTRNFGDFNVGEACIKARILNLTVIGSSIELSAWVFNKGDFSQSSNRGGIDLYFFARVSVSQVNPSNGAPSPLDFTVSTWENGHISTLWNMSETLSGSLGVAITALPTNVAGADIVFEVRCGISFVSAQNAKTNLHSQQDISASLESIVDSTVAIWEDHQDTMRIAGGVASSSWHRSVFETALYHTSLPPTTYSEVGGEFLGEDWQVHYLNETAAAVGGKMSRYVSDLSIWDIYRTQAPFLLWLKPTIAADLANSMLEMIRETDKLPVWVFANVETDCMVGHHSAIIFADYVMKGLPNINNTKILDAVVRHILQQSTEQLGSLGFIAVERNQRGASLTQDLSLDAGAARNLALFMNDSSSAALLEPFARDYANVWDNVTNYFCPRHANGTFACDDPFNPYPFEKMFTEGNGAEYRWYVPHDIEGMIALFPNRTYFVDQLDEFFAISEFWPLNTTLPNPAFWAGNEPDILTPVLFNFAGNEYAYLTSYWFPILLDRYYYPFASGIPGNDDYGTMSTWVVFGYIGIYPVASTTDYALFAPRFDSVDIALDANELDASPWGRVVTPSADGSKTVIVQIRAYNRPLNSENVFVANISVNGVPLLRPIVRHSQLVSQTDGTPTKIEFFLTDVPTIFGTAAASSFKPKRLLWSHDEANEKKETMEKLASRASAAWAQLNVKEKTATAYKHRQKRNL